MGPQIIFISKMRYNKIVLNLLMCLSYFLEKLFYPMATLAADFMTKVMAICLPYHADKFMCANVSIDRT
jgi:hypothetical protein